MKKVEREKSRSVKPAAKSFAKSSAKKTADKSFPISRRERNLRQKLDDINYELDEKRAKLTDENETKFAKLQMKIAKTRERQETNITRRETSRIYRKSRILYAICVPFFAIGRFFRMIWRKIMKHQEEVQMRNPHRSFYLTPMAKTRRGIKMKGYLGFIHEVGSLLWKNKRLFIGFLILYSIFAGVIIGLLSQDSFNSLRDALNQSPNLGFFAKYTALFSGAITGGGSSSTSTDSGQTILAVILFLYGWLTLIWLLRQIVNGHGGKQLKLRDGLYRSGHPILAIAVLILVILLQLLPFAIVLLAYSSITAVGWINQGIAIENMAAWCALAVAAVLTLYWISSSLVALVVVTIPDGIYPFAALRAAGDLVTSRRLQLVLRLIAMAVPIALLWLVLLLPAIFLDGWLASMKITWVPVVPLMVLILTTMTIIWCAAYIYLLYRKMVDDPTPPVPSDWQIKRANRREIREKQKLAKKSGKKSSENFAKSLTDKFAKKLFRKKGRK